MQIPWRRHKKAAVNILTKLGGLTPQEATDRVNLNGTLLEDIGNGVPMEKALQRLAARRAGEPVED